MPLAGCKELKSFLEQKNPHKCKVVVMPDFFLDRFINLTWDAAEFSGMLLGVAKRKGGSIDGIPQVDMRGGNAINVAAALARLGATVTPIVCTSSYGLQQMKYYFRNTPVNTVHIKTSCNASITTALEFQTQTQKTNVMLRDLGALADFGPENLNETDYQLIDGADYTCLFNWAGTLKFGTVLAQAVFGRVKRSGKGKTFYDTADPTPNKKSLADLMEKVLKTNMVDILSLNENEAITYASLLDERLNQKKEHMEYAELAMEAARILSKHLTSRIDLHTTAYSATLKGKTEVIVPSFKVKALRATGAGDAWDAGNIFGDHNGLSDECRLMLANAVSACYISDADGLHPTKHALSMFLKDKT
jgi:ribokinase